MLDLHLPADEYIDTEEGEQRRNEKESGLSSSLPNGNHKIAPEGGVKLFLGDLRKSGCEEDASKSDSSLRSSNGLADLNEPVQREETNAPVYIDLLGSSCHEQTRAEDLPAKKIWVNSHHGSNNGTMKKLCMENNENGRVRFLHVLEAGGGRRLGGRGGNGVRRVILLSLSR